MKSERPEAAVASPPFPVDAGVDASDYNPSDNVEDESTETEDLEDLEDELEVEDATGAKGKRRC